MQNPQAATTLMDKVVACVGRGRRTLSPHLKPGKCECPANLLWAIPNLASSLLSCLTGPDFRSTFPQIPANRFEVRFLFFSFSTGDWTRGCSIVELHSLPFYFLFWHRVLLSFRGWHQIFNSSASASRITGIECVQNHSLPWFLMKCSHIKLEGRREMEVCLCLF